MHKTIDKRLALTIIWVYSLLIVGVVASEFVQMRQTQFETNDHIKASELSSKAAVNSLLDMLQP